MLPRNKILLVDDDPVGAELTLAALSLVRSGVNVDIVGDGEEALDYVFRRGAHTDLPGDPPQAILLDLKMPKVDGYEVLRQIRAHDRLRSVTVVVLTSSDREADRELCRELGSDDYIVKPTSFVRLINELRRTESLLFPEGAGS